MNQIKARILNFAAGRNQPQALPYHLIDIHLGDAVRSVCRLEGREVSRLQVQGDMDILPEQ